MTDNIDLFPFLRLFFSVNDAKWNDLSPKAKTSHTYMLVQFLSIMYPVEMQVYNMKWFDMNHHVIDALRNSLKTKDYPGWMYTRAKSAPVAKDQISKFDKTILQLFLDKHDVDYKNIEEVLDVHLDDIVNELKELDKTYNKSNKPVNAKK